MPDISLSVLFMCLTIVPLDTAGAQARLSVPVDTTTGQKEVVGWAFDRRLSLSPPLLFSVGVSCYKDRSEERSGSSPLPAVQGANRKSDI